MNICLLIKWILRKYWNWSLLILWITKLISVMKLPCLMLKYCEKALGPKNDFPIVVNFQWSHKGLTKIENNIAAHVFCQRKRYFWIEFRFHGSSYKYYKVISNATQTLWMLLFQATSTKPAWGNKRDNL